MHKQVLHFVVISYGNYDRASRCFGFDLWLLQLQVLPPGHVALSQLVRLSPEDVTFPKPVEAGGKGGHRRGSIAPVPKEVSYHKNGTDGCHAQATEVVDIQSGQGA